jgi:anti-anti-sigma regulatory factor
MLKIYIEKMADAAVLRCVGRIVHSYAAFKLRDAVTKQKDARLVLVDLSELECLEGGGLGMLLFLHRWCRDQGIRLKLFDPPSSVSRRLTRAGSTAELEIVRTDEVLSLLGWDGPPNDVIAPRKDSELAAHS